MNDRRIERVRRIVLRLAPTMIEGSRNRRFLDPTQISQLKNMELRARLIVEGFITGLHRSPYHGFSVEFAEHRPYNPGDELRHVDWKVYAKTDRFYVKQYEEETNLRNYVVLDTSASMRYKHAEQLSKLAYSSFLAAGMHYLMLKQRDATGLIGFDEDIHTLVPPRSRPNYLRVLLRKLEEFHQDASRDGSRTNAAKTLHSVAERIKRRSLVILITDLFENTSAFDELLKALKHLRHREHEVLVFQVLEGQTEKQLDLPNRAIRLQDSETGETMTIHPSQLKTDYQTAVEAFSASFRKHCLEYDIDFVQLDTREPYDTALTAYLNKRKQLH